MLKNFLRTWEAMAAFTISLAAQSTTYTVTTFAGTGPIGQDQGRNRGDGGPASEARLEFPWALQMDARSNLYVGVTDADYNLFVRRISPLGMISTVQSPTFPMFLRPDGTMLLVDSYGVFGIDATGAPLDDVIKFPKAAGGTSSAGGTSFAVNSKGDVFMVGYNSILLLEAGDDRFIDLKVPYTGSVRPIAGLALDPSDRLYYFGDDGIGRLEADRSFTKVGPSYCPGYWSQLCANTTRDGPQGAAVVGQVQGMVFDSKGNAFFTERIYPTSPAVANSGCKVRMMAPDLSIRTIAGGTECVYQGDNGPGLQARFSQPNGIAIDSQGNLYVADSDANRVRKLTPNNPPDSNMRIAGLTQAATYQNQLAPGSIFTLFGDNIGPATLTSMQVANGKAATSLGGVRILFDGVPAPLLYVAAKQASGAVPFGLSGTSTKVQVEFRGALSPAVDLALVPAAPGFFTADGSGTGPAAAVNENGTINTQSQLAKAGSVVVLYATGFGVMTPAVDDGTIVTALAAPQVPISVLIDGVESEVLYAGAAPGLVAGVMQVNVRVPASAFAGALQIRIRAGGTISPQSVLLYVDGR